MKKRYKIILIIVMVVSCMTVLGGCGNNNPNQTKADNPGGVTPPIGQTTKEGQLATPTVKMASSSIYWNEIENADYYEVYVNGRIKKVTLETYYNYSLTVNGVYSFTVMARSVNPEYQNSEKSKAVSVTVSRLDLLAPDIEIEGNVISWNAVTGATNYDIYINGEPIEKPKFTIKDNIFYWSFNPTQGGKNAIQVCSLSNNTEYETQSDFSKTVYFDVSVRKKWQSGDILTDWSIFGGVETHREGICLECIGYSKSGLINYCMIESEKPYMFIDFCNTAKDTTEDGSKIKVYVNGDIVKPVGNTEDFSTVNGESAFAYDMSNYINSIVEIKVESIEGDHACIKQISFNTENRVSPYIDWSNTNFEEEWTSNGKVTLHDEGVCLENEGVDASITNNIFVTAQRPYLVVCLRKFIRINEEQDKDPVIYVYVNGVVAQTINGHELITATGDTPEKHIYDLRDYIGQAIEIEIVSKEGEHACIPSIYMSSKGLYSIADTWDASFIKEEWAFIGKVEVHTEGICLENNGEISALENKIQVSNEKSTFVISFRKFVRSGAQDQDPQIKVYVNGTLVRAKGSSADYVTVTGDSFVKYEFDLSEYKGQIVTVKVQNESGEHACFDTLYFQQ